MLLNQAMKIYRESLFLPYKRTPQTTCPFKSRDQHSLRLGRIFQWGQDEKSTFTVSYKQTIRNAMYVVPQRKIALYLCLFIFTTVSLIYYKWSKALFI